MYSHIAVWWTLLDAIRCCISNATINKSKVTKMHPGISGFLFPWQFNSILTLHVKMFSFFKPCASFFLSLCPPCLFYISLPERYIFLAQPYLNSPWFWIFPLDHFKISYFIRFLSVFLCSLMKWRNASSILTVYNFSPNFLVNYQRVKIFIGNTIQELDGLKRFGL